jgi:hypothetical protein
MGTDWYIDQAKRKAYKGEPVPIRMTKEMYQMGTRDFLVARNQIKEPQDLKNVMQEIYKTENNRREAFINTIDFYLDVDKEKVLKNGTVSPEDADYVVDRLVWRLPAKTLYHTNGIDSMMVISKAYIAMLDILAHNNWERPIYFVSTTSDEAYLGLNKYLQLEGLVYRLVPVEIDNQSSIPLAGRINSNVLYDILMNKYDYSQYADSTIFLSEDYTRMASNIKLFFLRLSENLLQENKMDSAINAMDKCYSWFPTYAVPYSWIDHYFARIYISTQTQDGVEKGVKLYNKIIDQFLLENAYYKKFTGNKAKYVSGELSQNMGMLREINQECHYLRELSLKSSNENFAKMLEPLIERTKDYGLSQEEQVYYEQMRP